MAKSSTSFKPGHVAPSHAHRKSKEELYRKPVRQAEKKIVDRLPAIVDQMILTALGETKEHLINHKTGEVAEVPVNPATQLKAQQYLLDRIAGKPETTKKHELGPVAAAGFSVLLGMTAEAHWAQLAPAQVNVTEGRELASAQAVAELAARDDDDEEGA